MNKQSGFTLIELIIAIAIIGILTAIAVPSYQQYVFKSNRTLLKAALSEMASLQQSYYSERKGYQILLPKLAKTGTANAPVYVNNDGSYSAAESTKSLYKVDLVAHAANIASCSVTGNPSTIAWTLKATPVKGQLKDTRCATMCLNSTGSKGASGSSPSSCW